MELGKNWGADPSILETFKQLGHREQNAVKVALVGITDWQSKRVPPKPMRVKVTFDNPFDLRGFAGILHELHVGITDFLIRDEADPDTVTFQPRPYSRIFMPEIDRDKFDAVRETARDELDAMYKWIPPEMRKRMGL